MQGIGIMAPAGELPLTVQQMFGSTAPSPVGLGKDQGAAINGLPRSGGEIGQGIGDAGIPALTGGAAPSMSAGVHDLPHAGASALFDLSHPAPWMLLLGIGLLLMVHFNVGVKGAAGFRK